MYLGVSTGDWMVVQTVDYLDSLKEPQRAVQKDVWTVEMKA